MTTYGSPSGQQHKRVDLALEDVSGDGSFSGYASLFGAVDLGRDVIEPGAFAASLKRRGAGDVRMLYQHDPDQLIGRWLSIREDARGLHVEGKLSLGVARAREVHELMKSGALDGLSIGFQTLRARNEKGAGVRRILSADLWEISVVTFPMQPGARVTAVKAASDLAPVAELTRRDLERRLTRDAGLTRRQARGLIARGYGALSDRQDAGPEDLKRLERRLRALTAKLCCSAPSTDNTLLKGRPMTFQTRAPRAPETKSVDADVSAAFEDFMSAFEHYRQSNDERLAEIERRGSTDVIIEEKMARIDTALDEQKRTLDALLVKRARPDLGRGAAQPSAVRQAFDAYVRRGDEAALRQTELKAMSAGSDPDGGYLVPDELDTEIGRRLSELSPIRSIATVRQVSGAVLKKPFALNGMATGWVGETDARPQTNAPQLAELQFPTMELYAMPAATASLIEDSAVDIEGWIASEVEAAFAEQEGAAFVAGDGVNKPRGFLDYPFVLMDVPAGNGLPNPGGGTGEPVYPWRGRMTASVAPGLPGTPDGAAAMRAEIDALCGGTLVSDVIVSGDSVSWLGGDEGYRRFILHHAALAIAAGGVDGFVIGSEMIGLTRLRDEAGAFPFVDQLIQLAADSKAMLGGATTVTYAADWTEYAGYRPDDGSGDVFFNLDPLWAHPAIGAIGIDNYMPLSDWRDADLSAGNPDGAVSANDQAAMRAAITGGEGYDWYYAGKAGRDARERLPITDGLAGKHWIYRVKDLRGWWQNQHYDRVGGAEAASPSPWVPGSKPFWFTELGCPAVDKGANQPNLFPDPKSSEGAIPWYSSGGRDDLAQRAFLEAHLAHWSGDANADGMVATDRIHLWTWDARPFPAFPLSAGVWSDGPNWRTGHWLNGRLGTVALRDLIAAILTEAGMTEFNVDRVDGMVTGHVISNPASVRAVLEPVVEAFAIDVREGPGGLVFTSRLARGSAPLEIDAVADPGEGALFEEIRGEPGEFANEAVLLSADPMSHYAPASARSRRLEGEPARQRDLPLSVAIEPGLSRTAADRWLQDHRLQRLRLRFALPPQAAGIEPGDTVRFAMETAPHNRFRITRIEDGEIRRIEAVAHVGAAAPFSPQTYAGRADTDASAAFVPEVLFLDLPVLTGIEETGWARAGALAIPWRQMVLSSSAEAEGYAARVTLDAPARIGALAEALPPGQIEGRFDNGAPLLVDLGFGGLSSASRLAVLNGANAVAVRSDAGSWEIIQFETAEEIAPGRWRLESLLRGQAGTDDAMRAGAASGASFIVLDGTLGSLGLSLDEAGRAFNWIAEPTGGLAGAPSPRVFAGGERALTPLSPVHLRAERRAEGVNLSWIRRGRLSADSWTPAEIADDEGFERYRVEILDGATVIRTVETTASEWLYPAADELADFGAPQGGLTFRVTQAGKRVPWGIARTATCSL